MDSDARGGPRLAIGSRSSARDRGKHRAWRSSTLEPTTTVARREGCTDERLARAAAAGDVGAFEVLYERHHRGLLSFCRHMLGGVHDAEDVVQHTFIAADAAFRDRAAPTSVRAWLYTVARNRCVSLLRARRHAPELPADLPSTDDLASGVELREELRALRTTWRAARRSAGGAPAHRARGPEPRRGGRGAGRADEEGQGARLPGRPALDRRGRRARDPLPVDPGGARGHAGRGAADASDPPPRRAVRGMRRLRPRHRRAAGRARRDPSRHPDGGIAGDGARRSRRWSGEHRRGLGRRPRAARGELHRRQAARDHGDRRRGGGRRDCRDHGAGSSAPARARRGDVPVEPRAAARAGAAGGARRHDDLRGATRSPRRVAAVVGDDAARPHRRPDRRRPARQSGASEAPAPARADPAADAPVSAATTPTVPAPAAPPGLDPAKHQDRRKVPPGQAKAKAKAKLKPVATAPAPAVEAPPPAVDAPRS